MTDIVLVETARILSILILAFGLTSLFTGMFEMMRSGFILMNHMILQFLATIGSIAVLITFSYSEGNFYYAVIFTVVFASLAMLKWIYDYMIVNALIFRSMQFSSIHMPHFTHLLILLVLSISALTMVF